MNINAILQQTGLTGNETKVYLAILDLGSALAGEITKRSGINRTNVYDALDRLIEKGMASYVIQANRKYFEATPPEQILSYLEEQQTEIENKKQNINSIIPDLAARRKLGKEPHEATVYKGKRGIKSVAEDVLRTKKEMFVYGAEGSFVKLFTHYAKQWHMRRGKLNIPLKIIFREEARKTKEKTKFPKAKIRFNQHLYDTPATTWIWGDKMAIVIWSDQPIATVIRSKDVAKSYRLFFNFLWKNSTGPSTTSSQP